MVKYYAVSRGRIPGIYETWEEASAQVFRFHNPVFKSFGIKQDAINWKKEADAIGGYPSKPDVIGNLSKPRETKLGKAQREHQEEADTAPEDVIKVYTDGGCRNTGNKEGQHVNDSDLSAWAFEVVYPDGSSYHDSGANFGKTNNMMELEAFARACEFIVNQHIKTPIMFILDSRYVLNPIQVGDLEVWAKQGWTAERANKEYWQYIWNYYSKIKQKIYLKWVKGHSVTQGNNYVDQLANEAMDALM